MSLPGHLDCRYRAATSVDILSWSFGAVTSPRVPTATHAENIRGTLHDQGIFGPIHDFRCACGKYAGDRFRNMICDVCRVKITSTASRSSRFGHIELPTPIPHPFLSDSELRCWPVLPMRLAESSGGQALLELYDKLIQASTGHSVDESRQIVLSISDHLLPATLNVSAGGIVAADTLAQGMALKTKPDLELYCAHCGYVIAGLQAAQCPGCGSELYD